MFVGFLAISSHIQAEDGYRLWLRYDQVKDSSLLNSYRRSLTSIVVEGTTATEKILRDELQQGLKGFLGKDIPIREEILNGSLLVGTPQTSPFVAQMKEARRLQALGKEGYLIQSCEMEGRHFTLIASQTPLGCLYGAFHLLRLLGTRQSIENLDIAEKPALKRRMLDHWDNLDGTIERGYAGKSLWRWNDLPARVDSRVRDYARACASIALNGAVLNNVNANPLILKTEYLKKTASLADALRPYGIQVYLSANFGTPKALGDLPTADPLDPSVQKWWIQKADEIYSLIPDFGGFLVKANSEGQPGPNDYGRTHAQGANMLAKALAPHGGIVMWRAFVYSPKVDHDRIKRAYQEFTPLDGKFLPNVFLQVKYGPLDFQPREPFHPLFGGMPKTSLAAELQVTQEYLGQSTHLVYLAPLWREFLDADTYSTGPGSTVKKVVEGKLNNHKDSVISGVANTGDNRNWCGHPFAQANWYAFGRLAWNPDLSAEAIAREWASLTWGVKPQITDPIVTMMMASREAFVDYDSPLGLNGVTDPHIHYAPMPWTFDPQHEDWSSTYFVHADPRGLGFDRTLKGSAAVTQYHTPLSGKFNSLNTCPEKYLLWFHHVPWEQMMKSGNTFWEELCGKYQGGVKEAMSLEKDWEGLKGKVDGERFQTVSSKLRQQVQDAQQWRDQCLKYFQTFSQKPIPTPGFNFPLGEKLPTAK